MKPIDMFRITNGTRVWTMTSAAREQTYGSGEAGALELYVPTPIGRGQIEIKNEVAKGKLEVTLPIDHELAVTLLSQFSEQIMTLTLFSRRIETEVAWKGRLAGLKPDEAELKMTFESIFTSMRRPGLRARFGKSCRHALYGRGCFLDPEDFATAATVTALTASTVTAPAADALADGYFTGGMLRSPGGILSFIINHVGPLITLQRVSYDLVTQFAETGSGMAITLYPGCDHTRQTCNSKFDNRLNYGGFDWIPQKNPMGGSSIV